MHKYQLTILISVLVVLSTVALTVFLKPLVRTSKIKTLLTSGVVITTVALSYIFWGGFADLYTYKKTEQTKQRSLTALNAIKNPAEVITKLEKHLELNPKSAKGWYLLGRLYASQNLSQQALAAFASAYQIAPDDEAITVNYAQSLLENNNAKGLEILNNLLNKNPRNQDGLAVMAMYYYSNSQHSTAIEYWQKLLDTLPTNSAEADDIRKIIAKVFEDGSESSKYK